MSNTASGYPALIGFASDRYMRQIFNFVWASYFIIFYTATLRWRYYVFATSVCSAVRTYEHFDATRFLENGMSDNFDIWWGGGPIPSADLKRVAAQNMLIKYLICIIYCFLMRHIFLRMVCWMVMILGEGKGPYCPQTGKELQPNTSHNMQIK